MSASPTLWIARTIFAVAVGLGVVYVVSGPATRPEPAVAQPAPGFFTPPPPPPLAPSPAPSPLSPRPEPAPTENPDTIKRILDTGGPIRYGEWFWDDAGVPVGRVVVTVDLKANILSVFRAGYEVGTAAVIYGADSKPTPVGTYPVIGKDADHVSNLYNAPMPYMLRLTNDGISIHGSKVAFDAATHGCIGVPTPFARKLFGLVRVGDRVIVTRGGVGGGHGRGA